MSSAHLPPPWPRFLADVDRSLSESVEIHCLGGFALTAVYGIPRTTADLDYIAAIPRHLSSELESIAGRGSSIARTHKVFLQFVGVADLPDDYGSRLSTLPTNFERLTLRVLEPYDLILSKLTRNSPKDMEDVKALAQTLRLEFRVLIQRFESEMNWLPNRARHQQTLHIVWQEDFRR